MHILRLNFLPPLSISSMTATVLQPLAMSQTKDDLIKYLNMGLDTYALMAVSALA